MEEAIEPIQAVIKMTGGRHPLPAKLEIQALSDYIWNDSSPMSRVCLLALFYSIISRGLHDSLKQSFIPCVIILVQVFSSFHHIHSDSNILSFVLDLLYSMSDIYSNNALLRGLSFY